MIQSRRAGARLRLACACALLGPVLWSGAAQGGSDAVAVPLRLVDLNPFRLVYGVPASFGARLLALGDSELIASIDMASYLSAARSKAERILLDGETYRLALAARRGLGRNWEGFLEISAVAHSAGAFDRFIESWHDAFGLPQGGRDRGPHDRLSLYYADAGGVRVDIDSDVAALGDMAFGVGYALPRQLLSNDGLALRAAIRLPTGAERTLAGAGGPAATVWAETSGALPGAAASRAWLYAATLGALAAEAPRALRRLGGRLVAFGRFGVTWRPLESLSLTAQIDAHSSPWRASGVAPLADASIMLGFGGALRLADDMALEIAVTEDDGARHATPDIGLHVGLRWRP